MHTAAFFKTEEKKGKEIANFYLRLKFAKSEYQNDDAVVGQLSLTC